MTEYVSADDLLGGEDTDLAEDVAMPSGRTFRVRGLSRFEWFLAGKVSSGEADSFEVEMIAMGLVEPKLTKKQVEAWRKRPGTVRDISAVSDRIRILSGVGDDADKSDVQPVGEQS